MTPLDTAHYTDVDAGVAPEPSAGPSRPRATSLWRPRATSLWRPRAVWLVLAASIAFAVAGVAVGLAGRHGGSARSPWVSLSDDGPAPFVDPVSHDITFVIPAGTAQRQAAGEKVVVLPTRVGIKVGQRLSLRNDDSKAVVIGQFFVGPHETSTFRFSSPRQIYGACDLHPSGSFLVEVTA